MHVYSKIRISTCIREILITLIDFRYDKISEDQEFPYQLKETVRKIIIALANRYVHYITIRRDET